ncbi:membrane protein insertion efficiency factor YidD [Polaribacter sp.]|uniref:membrane protein insertion efficiency factor YidD n=1 Tax=Polaribacter sp. TaxID=1920175 RepID=UPI003EF8ED57
MKYFLIFIIKIYWKTIPVSKRNKCLFKESCSNYVFKITKKEGFIKGFKALIKRINNCKPGYNIIDIESQTYIITANNEMYQIAEMRSDILD